MSVSGRPRSLRPAFVGIDVAFAKRKILPVVVCTWQNGRLIPEPLRGLGFSPPRGQGNAATLELSKLRSFADDTARYLRKVADVRGLALQRIALDAPSAPTIDGLTRRMAERAMDQAGISCFATPTEARFEAIRGKVRAHLAHGGAENRLPHANQLWMLVGFQLFRRLRDVAPCIEVFPQATARVLGAAGRHKSKSGAVAAQFNAAAAFTGWPADDRGPAVRDIGFGPRHDLLDAYLSAWVAALEEKDRTAHGSPPHDVIWTPKVGGAKTTPMPPAAESRTRAVATRPKPTKPFPGKDRLCPACGAHRFARWPWGWDAHAAHRCTAVVGATPEERKQDFRLRFLDR